MDANYSVGVGDEMVEDRFDQLKRGDSPEEACGVFGIRVEPMTRSVSHATYDGLYALQHRGQESAGMAVSDGTSITVVKNMGLVSNVFDDRTLLSLPGNLAIGHTRYSTTGSSTWGNAQPVFRAVGDSGIALGHNGNLTNTQALSKELGFDSMELGSDSDLIAHFLATEIASNLGGKPGSVTESIKSHPEAVLSALEHVLPKLKGAFSLVIMDHDRLIGVRDPNGFRPLCLGRLEAGYVIASETPALDVVGATFIREVEPGEMVIVDELGVRSFRPFPPESIDPKLCIFEFVYFARPDARLLGQEVYSTRRRMGELLAKALPVDADLVMGVPDSGVPAAVGYSSASHIPYGQGLVKNRYIGRTFISPDPASRIDGVRRKLNVLRDNISGKRLVVVDDSIVRGTTTKAMVKLLKESGATEVHLRISSPPYRWSCFYGIDTPSRPDLLASFKNIDEIKAFLEVDSIAYLDLEDLKAAIGSPEDGFCDACLTGSYPIDVPEAMLNARRPKKIG
ncbi:amidophosphoribosyltransferase [Acidithrix sp. C25]|uniref:amidophosphoribosyltransferase n=1 Tax=Acidithrix sp. C25 TaxID=1671482 RepID=UPI001BC17AA4|nr:amidophosphoribosyltransferase [Acidithrix sp. C25]CAG4933988.1 unnamed protein product [Acidithrix sp. C25]